MPSRSQQRLFFTKLDFHQNCLVLELGRTSVGIRKASLAGRKYDPSVINLGYTDEKN